jgi:truncated hemoglobin YjbI
VSRFRIDDSNLYEEIGPEIIVKLAREFYTRVYADTDPWFRDMFPDDMESAIQNQYEFFMQRFGGPNIYSERKGHPALRGRHARFRITKAGAERWLKYMHEAMDAVGLSDNAKERMSEFFTDTAFFLQNEDDAGQRLY